MYFQLSEPVLKLLALDIADLDALLNRGSGGNSGGVSGCKAGSHDEASVRNCVSFRLSPVLLYTCSVEPGTGHVVNVEVEVRAADDPVVENLRGQYIVFVQRVHALEMSGLADAHHRSGADNVAVFKSRDELS